MTFADEKKDKAKGGGEQRDSNAWLGYANAADPKGIQGPSQARKGPTNPHSTMPQTVPLKFYQGPNFPSKKCTACPLEN